MGACDITSCSPGRGGERTGLSDKQAQSQDMILTHICEVIATLPWGGGNHVYTGCQMLWAHRT